MVDTLAGLICLAVGVLMFWGRDEFAYFCNWQSERLFGLRIDPGLARGLAVVMAIGWAGLGVMIMVVGTGRLIRPS